MSSSENPTDPTITEKTLPTEPPVPTEPRVLPVPATIPEGTPQELLPPVIAGETAAVAEPVVGPRPVPDGPSKRLIAAVVATGLGLLALTTATLPGGTDPQAVGYKIGILVGTLVFWPGVVVGLFSIGRRFRTPRNRLRILLGVWVVIALSAVGKLSNEHRQAQAKIVPPAARVTLPSFGSKPAASPARATLIPAATSGAGPGAVPEVSRYDLSAGSDRRLIKLIEGAQEATYHEVVAAYAAETARRPDDARLALERVRFIARFAQAEDLTIESAEADYAAAHEELLERFPAAPGTRIFELERSWGKAFEEKAERWAAEVERWPLTEAARFNFLRAQRAEAKDPMKRVQYAEVAFVYAPEVEAGLLYAEALHDSGQDDRAAKALEHPIFRGATPWEKQRRMNLLFQLRRWKPALTAYDELKKVSPESVRRAETAAHLAEAGRVAGARALFAEIPRQAWNRDRLQRARFEFELAHGDAAQAEAAYRELRGAGLEADPLARDRATLLRRHPGAGWAWTDLVGALLLVLCVATAAAVPLLLLIPVHYWSLWRRSRGRVDGWTISPWGLRAAWALLGLWGAGEVIGAWIFQPELLRGQFAGKPGAVAKVTIGLGAPTLVWVVATLAGLWLVGRTRAWRLFGPGTWGWWQAIGTGVGAAVGLRFALGLYVQIVPGAREVLAPAVFSMELAQALIRAVGPVGLVAVVGLFVPVLEELVFRGVLLGALAKHVPFWAANAAQAACFAAVHESLVLFPFFAGLAAIAGVLVRRSSGLSGAIAIHAANNLIVCAVVLTQRGG